MHKKLTAMLLLLCIAALLLLGCSPDGTNNQIPVEGNETASSTDNVLAAASLPDGIYSVDFNTDSGMFHVNEACDGKGTLTVQNGQMSVHVTLVSKSIVNLFVGTAEDAQKEGAVLLNPTEDPVTYKDGFKETVFGFDIPIEELDHDFSLAIIGKKGTWYDHTVSISNPEPLN